MYCVVQEMGGVIGSGVGVPQDVDVVNVRWKPVKWGECPAFFGPCWQLCKYFKLLSLMGNLITVSVKVVVTEQNSEADYMRPALCFIVIPGRQSCQIASLKPGVHTNDFAPIHGRPVRIHTAPSESTVDSTYCLPQALCEYARGDRESGRNR